ncbi:DCPS [Lepeophtheirus salmonis]|uniref:m7GpppX diphosphatase n=1 Tax=Lepeophtheirus salmonis TaxID=72036 RepID=A0A7R8HAJ6_LEPSM|nr:DCPS [Lepeophtheirus salmonis]CAF2957599.1 DCPS [Lepeophtheirus salmonis]
MDVQEAEEMSLTHLRDFKIKRKLNHDPEHKLVAIEGYFTWDKDRPALLLLEKSILSMDSVKNRNAKITMHSPFHIIQESSALYCTLTQDYLKENTFSLDWVYNILDHKKEQEHILFENSDPESGYIVAKDYNWDGKNIEDMHYLAIVHSRNISSLRSLRSEHLPILKNIYKDGTKAIFDKHGIRPSQMRVYLHYQPSFYHLHVHFVPLLNQKGGIHVEKAHLLQDIIDNIENYPNFYEEASISFGLKESDRLYQYYKDAGYNFELAPNPEANHDNLLTFFKYLGQAKHEPCGEHWLMTFGESAWRMAILSMCLPSSVDRVRLCKISLTSAFTCFGTKTDQNSQWSSKLSEVKKELFRLLPFSKAVELYDMYSFHVATRMGQNCNSNLSTAYRGILEVEEALLQTEELAKEEELSHEEVMRILINRMDKAKFMGYEKYEKTGWVRFGVNNPETVASHMFRMGLMSLIFSDCTSKDIRNGSSVIVSLLHDVAEYKHAREMKAIGDITKPLRGDLGLDIFTNFERYEFQKDAEAKLTKEIDKLDMIIQAHEYEVMKKEKFLQEFFDSTVGKNIFAIDVTKNMLNTWLISEPNLTNNLTILFLYQ